MTIALTREEWLEARERFLGNVPGNSQWDKVVEAVLGPCPPGPPPRVWFRGYPSTLVVHRDAGSGRVWVGFHAKHELLTPDEAEAMAAALTEHAHYIREQEAGAARRSDGIRDDPLCDTVVPTRVPAGQDNPICGLLLVGPPGSRAPGTAPAHLLCQRPKGHDGGCRPIQDFPSQPEDERAE